MVAALAAIPAFAVTAAIPETSSAIKAVAYIRTTQQPDGGFGGFGDGQTYDAILALRSAGVSPSAVLSNGKSPVDFLVARASAADTPAIAAKAALAARAAGLEPRAVGGTDLIANIKAGYSPATGLYASDDFSQSLAMLGLACTGNTVPSSAILGLRTTQVKGGWGFGGNPEPDTTALAIQALIASGVPASDASIVEAFAYLKSAQGTDGGWGFDPTASNANSTAFVLQAYLAAGVAPDSMAKDGKGAVAFLLSQQGPDGAFAGFDPAFSTNQVLPLLLGRTFCNAPDTTITIITAPTATATVPASASPSPTIVAPRPPNTGSGLADESGSNVLLVALGGAILLFGSATVFATRRK